MPPLNYPLRIKQGETWELTIPVIPSNPAITSIDGMTARAQVRDSTGADLLLHEWSTENGNITAADLAVTLTVPAATSAAWLWRRGVWALELSDPGTGESTTLVEGWAYVYPEIVR